VADHVRTLGAYLEPRRRAIAGRLSRHRTTDDRGKDREKAEACPHSPISLPRISFMSPEHGTGGHAGSSGDTDSLQMSLFEDEGDDGRDQGTFGNPCDGARVRDDWEADVLHVEIA
jgi:hypothetical protein